MAHQLENSSLYGPSNNHIQKFTGVLLLNIILCQGAYDAPPTTFSICSVQILDNGIYSNHTWSL